MTEQTIIDLGYTSPKLINGVWCGILRLVFNTGLVVGIDEYGYLYRYCYHTFKEANEALLKYNDINEHPPGDWIKRKGEGGDLVNPNTNMHN